MTDDLELPDDDALACLLCGKTRPDGWAELSRAGRTADGWRLVAYWAVCGDHPTGTGTGVEREEVAGG